MKNLFKLFFFTLFFHWSIAQPSKGQKVKNIHTVTASIEEFDLFETTKKQNVLLVFYRGLHSQPCNKFLKNLSTLQPLMIEKNILTVFITPDNPVNIEKTQQKFLSNFKNYVFIHDYDCKIMQDYQVDMKIAKSKESFYKISGFANNKEHFILPMSATILIDQNQRVVYSYYSKNPIKRPSIKVLNEEFSKI